MTTEYERFIYRIIFYLWLLALVLVFYFAFT